jgi:hypothetical protein
MQDPASGQPTCRPPAEDGPARSGLSLPVGEQPAPGEDRQRATTNAEWTIARHRRSKTTQEKSAPTTTPTTPQPITCAQAAHPASVVRPPCPPVQLRASLLAQDPASRVQALLSAPRPPRPATQVSSLVVSLRLKRSAWQDKTGESLDQNLR